MVKVTMYETSPVVESKQVRSSLYYVLHVFSTLHVAIGIDTSDTV